MIHHLYMLGTLGALASANVAIAEQAAAPSSLAVPVPDTDPALKAWLNEFAMKDSLLAIPPAKVSSVVKTQDPITGLFFKMRYQNTGKRVADSTWKQALQILNRTSERNPDAHQIHPLAPYLIEEVLQSSRATKAELNLAASLMERYGERSCPAKDAIVRNLYDGGQANLSVDKLESLLDRIASFTSKRFEREALQAFLNKLPVERQEALRSKIYPLAKPYPTLMRDNTWLEPKSTDTELAKLQEPNRSLQIAERAVRGNNCRTAKLAFLSALGSIEKNPEYLGKAREMTLDLESCFRRSGTNARLNFLREIRDPLDKAFGLAAAEVVDRRLAMLSWGRDEFADARERLAAIVSNAKKENLKDVEGLALFDLARVSENEGKVEDALKLYEEFIDRFAEAPEAVDAQMSRILLYASMQKDKEGLEVAKQIVKAEDRKKMDDRNITAMSFAMFWAGRFQYHLGKESDAKEYWQRVATEYYSTFYGALGHYILERMGTLNISPPARERVGFKISDLYAAFSDEERRTVARIEALLKLGLRDEASCEIAELDTSDKNPNKILTVSLLQHASGDWLPSIKNFDLLPRSYRDSLAAGFERLLFPLAYEGPVKAYAKRLGVDSAFVLAIIRQESVFNPKAASDKGARGLMQLMPATARVEERRLSRQYLNQRDRAQLKSASRSPNNLFDANTNLALGVHHVYRLLQTYENPIFVLTSYNANPRATQRWMTNLPTSDPLAFIERIPYKETRAYVKLVLRNYFYYNLWYEGSLKGALHFDKLAENILGTRAKASEQGS